MLTGPLDGVLRAKGTFWVVTQPELAFEFSLAGRMTTIRPFGRWWAGTPQAAWPTEPEILDRIRRSWAEPFGDRRQEIVLIGRDLDRTAITAALDACLLRNPKGITREAIAALPDPFRQTVAATAVG